jgi:cyclopropane fatty-acyl-phospholipid synthase-like methyltransferase
VGKRRSGSVPSTLYDEEYFLHACEGHEEFRESAGHYLSQRLSEALAVAGIASGMTVLDVGCGRGEILNKTARMGVRAMGIDYAETAVQFSRDLVLEQDSFEHPIGIYQASALCLPFEADSFDRVLMLDIVEHLYPEELAKALDEAYRVLRPGGRIVIHTAPNRWYDQYAYPLVRRVRIWMGQGEQYPRNPREIIPQNVHVHVNEQSALSLWRNLKRHHFTQVRAWLNTPPQRRNEIWVFRLARWVFFNMPPFRWFFEREVFAVGGK